jgi:hypothetical protein
MLMTLTTRRQIKIAIAGDIKAAIANYDDGGQFSKFSAEIHVQTCSDTLFDVI